MFLFFGSKQKCNKCFAINPFKSTDHNTPKPNYTNDWHNEDWHCVTCDIWIFRTKNECFQCHRMKN
jgi:hypothetical protein